MSNKVKLIKLVTGEVVVATVVKFHKSLDGNEFVQLKNPVTLSASHEGVRLLRWPFLVSDNENEIDVNTRHLLVSPLDPAEGLVNAYNQEFGSGIVVANARSLAT